MLAVRAMEQVTYESGVGEAVIKKIFARSLCLPLLLLHYRAS